MNLTYIINKFNFGEASPLLAGRTDFNKYIASSKRLENFLPLVQGPIKKRGGTKFICKTKYADKKTCLIRFEANEQAAYILEFGDKYIRIIKDYKYVKTSDGQIYEIKTNFAEDDLFYQGEIPAFKYVQSVDVLYLVNPKHKPMKLARHSETDWRLTELGGWGIKRANAQAITLFRERLVLAAGQKLYFSASGAFEEFDIPLPNDPKPDDPIEIEVFSDQLNKIEWLVASAKLIVGTTGGEFIVGETTMVDPLGPANIKVALQTNYGSSYAQALRVGEMILFLQRTGKKLRELSYDYTGDSYAAQDLTIASDHITGNGLKTLVWQNEPNTTIWANREDGALIGFTYCREQDMSAWHRHYLGGNGKVKSLACIPAPDGKADELYLLVDREINGEKTKFIECLTSGLDYEVEAEKAFFVDAGLSFSFEEAQIKLNGLEHLEGELLAVLADGAPQPDVLVKDGKAELAYEAKNVQIGFPYKALVETLRPEIPLPDGTMQNRKKRIVNASLRVYRSLGGKIAQTENEIFNDIEIRLGSDLTDTAIPLFTGDLENQYFGGNYNTNGNLIIKHDQPLPFILVAIIFKIVIENVSQ